ADPLRSGSARNLLLEHPHRVGKRSHSVPTQLHVVIETATDDVHVAVDQSGNDAAPLEVEDLGAGAGHHHDVAFRADGCKAVALDGDPLDLGIAAVELRKPSVTKDRVGLHLLCLCASQICCCNQPSGRKALNDRSSLDAIHMSLPADGASPDKTIG